MLLAALGGGLIVMRGAGLMSVLTQGERCVAAFILGTGLIGWLAFFPGIAGAFNGGPFVVILAIMTGGLFLARTPAAVRERDVSLSPVEWMLLAGIAAMMFMDGIEALSPTADGDTMAYHFETPRRFLQAGEIFAIHRAIDGITQLLLQTGYGVAMGLGGEKAASLWLMLSGWGPGALFYVLARRHMARPWALTGTLCLMTAPALIYASGTGQVEVRVAGFALLGAYAAAMAMRETADPRHQTGWLILAGLAAGFFCGSKMTGLIFMAGVSVILISRTGSMRRIAVFSAAAFVAGIQWYAFNFAVTGDPFYPMLWKLVDLKPGFGWSPANAEALTAMWRIENAVPRSVFWFFAYPIRTVIEPLAEFQSVRIGVGPAALMCLPFAAIAAAGTRGISHSALFRTSIVAAVFYIVWFFAGPTLQIRHLIPVYPIVLLGLFAGMARFAHSRPTGTRVLLAGFAALLAVQLAGQALFTKKYAVYLSGNATPEAFLSQSISGYPAVEWLNRHLSADDRVLVQSRDWLFRLEVPYLMAHPVLQTQVRLTGDGRDIDAFIDELHNSGITHIAVERTALSSNGPTTLGRLAFALEQSQCLRRVVEIKSPVFDSRTLPTLNRASEVFIILKLLDCPR